MTAAKTTKQRARLSIDLSGEARRRIKVAAARRDVSIREYVLEAVQARVREDLGDDTTLDDVLALTAETDPVLSELWDNDKDAAYDRLSAR